MIQISELIEKAKQFEKEIDSSKEKSALKHLHSFLSRFPIDRLHEMTLHNYSLGYSKDSFSNWVEKKTKDIARISGAIGLSAMFGIWSNESLVPNNKFIIKEKRKKKEIDFIEANEKFKDIKKTILKIIEFGKEENFKEIDDLPYLWHIAKSKILFLYYPNLTTSIMKKDHILSVCDYIGVKYSPKYPIEANNKLLRTIREIDYFKEWDGWKIGSLFYWDKELNLKSKEESTERNYYILGSKYGQYHQRDIFPLMVKKSALGIGFCWKQDLTPFVNTSKGKLDTFLRNKGYESNDITSIKHFLSMKEGDLVAIKSSGAPIGTEPRLAIKAYAIVKKKGGILYEHDPDRSTGLGHLMHAEFIEKDFTKELKLGGYGKAIHKLSKVEHIKKIFGAFYEPERFVKKSSGVTTKNTNSQIRTINSSQIIVEAVHNKIQEKYYNILVNKYGQKNVKMEKNYVDITLNVGDKTVYFEVKPFLSIISCIQEATGQLLRYLWQANADPNLSKIIVVGQSQPNDNDKTYIEYMKNNLKLEFEYVWISI
ncbi:hypothetical protein JXB41_03085 [Candidatus Woesearchaeota archaeon]|nr:hypothetical protein [Candidatus Woesearchaeota archaeon]